MKTLEEIANDVGQHIFNKLKADAERKLKTTCYMYKEAEAKHAYIYEEIVKGYETYLEKVSRKRRSLNLIGVYNWEGE